jgi:serine O-acetyltransferase
MVGIPARPVGRRNAPTEPKPDFQPYAVCGDIPDPVARALNGLLDEVTSLRARIAELEQQGARHLSARDTEDEQPSLRLVTTSACNGADGD